MKREVMKQGDSREYHRDDREDHGYRTEYRRGYRDDRIDRFRDHGIRMRDDRMDRVRDRFDRMRDDRMGDRGRDDRMGGDDRMRDYRGRDYRTDHMRNTPEDRSSPDHLRDSRNFREYRREPQTFGNYQSYATRFRSRSRSRSRSHSRNRSLSHSRSRPRYDSARDVSLFHFIES